MSLIHLLLKAGKIDLVYLSQFTNAPALVENETGLLLKDADNKELVIDKKSGKLVAFDTKNIQPSLTANHKGNQTVFYHMIEKYLSDEFSPEAVSERTGIKAGRIRAIAAEIARVAFEESFEIDQELSLIHI